MVRLGEGEYAEIRQPATDGQAASSAELPHELVLANGQRVTVDPQGLSAVEFLVGSKTKFIYAPSAPNITIHKTGQTAPLPDQMLPPAAPAPDIGQKLAALGPGATVPVVIQMNVGFDHFYEHGLSAAKRAQKGAQFDAVKSRVQSLIQSHGKSRIKRNLEIINGLSADVDSGALQALSNSPDVKKVEFDQTVHAVLDLSAAAIHATDVWPFFDSSNHPLTGIGKVIAVIDTGVDYTHPDLGGCLGPTCKVIGGWDFVNNDPDPIDDMGHGTHCAATIAGNGLVSGTVLKGIAPDAKILAYKVLNYGGSGSASDIISGINRAVDPNNDGNPSDHADVISMSLGGPGDPDDSMSLAVDNASAVGVVSAIAAGNSGPTASTVGSPGVARTAVTVAAACDPHSSLSPSYCSSGPIASFSSRGPVIWNGVDIQKPDVTAPGVMICAAKAAAAPWTTYCYDNAHVRISGTSMATPHVAGALAILRQAYPTFTPQQVKTLIKSTAENLGVTYNDQGAGLVNLKAAIPGTQLVNATPASMPITTDATKKLSVASQIFSVTPVDSSLTNLSVSFETAMTGVTASFTKTTLNVANQTMDSFTATVTVDNDVILTGGSAFASIVLSENGQTKGIIPVIITLTPTITITPSSEVDYGADDPSQTNWTSPVKSYTVTNRRQDVSQTVNFSVSGFAAGIALQMPSSLSVPPGTSSTLNTQFVVDNTQIPNGFYNGLLNANQTNTIVNIPVKFSKYYVMVLHHGSSDFLGWVFIHNRVDKYYWITLASSIPDGYQVYLDQPGTYDATFNFSNSATTSFPYRKVFKEGIAVNSAVTSVTASASEAVNLLTYKIVDAGGAQRSIPFNAYSWMYIPAGFGLSGGYYQPNAQEYWSNASTNYSMSRIYEDSNPSTQYLWYYRVRGVSGSQTLTNSPGDFQIFNISGGQEVYPSTGVVGQLNATVDGTGFNIETNFSAPYTQTVYSLLPGGPMSSATPPSTENVGSFLHLDNPHAVGCVAGTPCPTMTLSPAFTYANQISGRDRWQAFRLPAMQENTVYTGMGPSIWDGKFNNNSDGIQLSLYSGYTLLHRQDFGLQEYAAIPYAVYQGNTQVAAGTLPEFQFTWLTSIYWPPETGVGAEPFPTLANPSVPAGAYQWKQDIPYQIKGQSMMGHVVASFDTSRADPNPPAIKRLNYFAGTARSETYIAGVPNRVEFELDPVGGYLGTVSVDASTDGTAFTPMVVTSNNGIYSAVLPDLSSFTKMTVRLTAADNSANTLSYSFEIPKGIAPPLITSSASASGMVGTAFTYQITASNNPTSFSASGLPSGVSVNAATGLISGTPGTAGTFSATINAANSGGTGSAPLSLSINPAPIPVITSTGPTVGQVGVAFQFQITATNGPTAYNATGLPSGLSINTTSGLISGTPTRARTTTSTQSANNSFGAGSAPLTITITNPISGAPIITSAGTAAGQTSSAINYQITATNSPTSFGATGLPPGLSINSASGLISGTPILAGISNIIISATNGSGIGTANLTLSVGQGSLSACDVNSDGFTNVLDVQRDVTVAIGMTAFSPNYDINKDGQCNVLDVQRVTNAALGGQCVSP